MSIKFNDVSLSYQHKEVIKNLNLEIKPGSIVAIIGKNGAGKSTLLKSLVKLIKPNTGDILIDNVNIKNVKQKDLAKSITLLVQKPDVPEQMSVKNLVAQGRYAYQKPLSGMSKRDLEIVNWAIKECNIDHIRNELVTNLSGGQLQCVWLAMVLAQKTKYILLDEPTTYLDVKNQLEILTLLKKINKEYKTTIIMTLHDINLASKFADYIIAVDEGSVVFEGSVKEVINSDNINQLFDVNTTIVDYDYPTIIDFKLKEEVNE